jgi:hypothetical protein
MAKKKSKADIPQKGVISMKKASKKVAAKKPAAKKASKKGYK